MAIVLKSTSSQHQKTIFSAWHVDYSGYFGYLESMGYYFLDEWGDSV